MRYYKIFFPVLVLLLLMIPLFHMNMSEITEQENRTLAKFPEIKKKNKLNESYGKDFESWLGDHFWGRDQLIQARFKSLYKINGRIENERAFIGDDGWMFSKEIIPLHPTIHQRWWIKNSVEKLVKFADKFKGKNIPIYLVPIPDRSLIYKKYWERYYKKNWPTLDAVEEMEKMLENYPNIKIVPIKAELQEIAKSELVFYKNDSHLTPLSESIITKKIFSTLKKDYNLTNIQLKQLESTEKTEETAYLSALLDLPAKHWVEQNNFIIIPELNSTTLEEKIFKRISVLNSEEKLNAYTLRKTEKAPIQKKGYFLGPCYTANSYNILYPLFSEAIKIYPMDNLDEEASSFIKNELQKLEKIETDSSVIIIVIPPTYFYSGEGNKYFN